MGCTSHISNRIEVLSNNSKLIALETSLHQSVVNFQELALDLQQLSIDSESYRLQYLEVKDKCENKSCMGAEELRKIIATKDHIIQAVASTLTKLNETKDFKILAEAFKILFDDAAPLTPPTEITPPKSHPSENSNKAGSSINENITTSKADLSITEDVSYREESLCEIEGTPAGRTSPIIPTRKTRSNLAQTEVRDKKKCPGDWPTPESKAVKLIFALSRKTTPKGSGKMRQSRLNLVTKKLSTVVDLTCSPDTAHKSNQLVQPLIKKESIEDDTILPSPTSGTTNFTLSKTISKPSPSKFKKPKTLSLKSRCENRQNEYKDSNNATSAVMDESINLLNQFANRIRDIKKENTQKESPVKKEKYTPTKNDKGTPVKQEMASVAMEAEPDEDVTNASISLQDVEQIEAAHAEISPLKRPLAENINVMNTPPKHEAESSMSILRPETRPTVDAVRRIPKLVEPLYKEPVVRKKSEKRNLQGWSCEECMNFYGVLYKDDPVMLGKKIQECSKHRGRHNPAPPKTPPNFWNPRWTVPDDTEELNRMNNAN